MDWSQKTISMPVGIVLRRTPGVTRWAKWNWRASAVMPGAGAADWRVLREEDGAVEYHAATLQLELHRGETESYLVSLAMEAPSVYVVLRPAEEGGPHDVEPFLVTASAYEAQDYLDSGEEIVEAVPAPEGLVAWIRAYCDAHHVEEEFKKRKRRQWKEENPEDGRGDARVRQDADVYRAPSALKPKSVH